LYTTILIPFVRVIKSSLDLLARHPRSLQASLFE
jgi:hypothetical protein